MSTLTRNAHTIVDASAGPITMNFPTAGLVDGDEVSCEKTDNSTNAVSIAGSIRGVAAQTLDLTAYRETVGFRYRASDSSWYPLFDHRTKASITALITATLASDTTVAAAASSAVGTALGTAGVLSAATAPTLDTTRVPDPQAKTSGGSQSGVTMPITRITTGLPAGFAYGLKTVRAGALSAVHGQIYFGSATSTDPLRIPVTAGETLTAAAYGWTDQASSKARMDVYWYGASGFISSTAGTYSNIVTSTWEQRVITAVAPAGATYCTPNITLSTQSGNTVVGAICQATGCIVLSGTVASPTYVDGTQNSLGWYWSGTAHASTAKKVQFLAAEVESPTGSQAKVDAHAAAADPHTNYALKSIIPTLGTNRAIDPQLKVAGASASSPSYPIARITTGLPSGFSYGIESTRAGALSGIISQMYLAPAIGSQADPLRIPVTPGETFSVSALMWTDQANARARLDIFYCDASGALIGSVVAGTYSNIAASTWETRSQIGVVVPALAAYATLQSTVAVISGGGNTVTGAKARATGVLVVTGTSLPAYSDGTFSGWAWSGAPHASASVKKFASAIEVAAAGGAFTVTKTGSALALSRAFATTKTLVQNLNLTGSSNGAFNIVSTTLDGATIHANGDDICPIRMQLGTVGANHGYSNVRSFTNPDGKTTADLGSQWQDTAGRKYVLLGFTTDPTPKLIIGGDYTSPGGVTTSPDVAPVTDLTHVSGATHTGTIDHNTLAAGIELLPVLGRITTSLWADGKPVTLDGTISSHNLVVRETYSILDYGSIYDTAKANVGVSLTTLAASIAGCVRVSNAYRWLASGCLVSGSLTELKPTTLGQCGGVQSAVMSLAGSTVTRYLPGVGTVSGFNWTTGVPLASYSTDVTIASGDVVTTGRPPALSLDVLDNGSPLVGFALGYLPYGKRGDELSTSANRLTHAGTKLWDLRGTQKNYPNFTMNEAAGWGHITYEAFRAYIDPTQITSVLASKGDAASAWETLSTAADLS